MTEPLWEQKSAECHEDGRPYWVTLVDPEGWWRAEVRWDGCVHFYRYFNTPMDPASPDRDEDMDSIHLCSVDELIERLTALRAAIQSTGMWPDGKDNAV